MPEEHNHGGSEHWEHVDIPEYYEVVIHGVHVHLGQFENAHIGYYRQGEVLEQPKECLLESIHLKDSIG